MYVVHDTSGSFHNGYRFPVDNDPRPLAAPVRVKAVADPYRRSLLRQQRSRDTRSRIARASVRLWSAHGLNDVTVEEVCIAAGVARSTYYLHFTSREDVLGELSMIAADAVAGRVLSLTGESTPLAAALEMFVDELAQRARRMPKHLLAAVMTTAVTNLADVGHLDDDRTDFGQLFAILLTQARRRGDLRSDEDPEELAAVVSGMVMEGLLRWARGTSTAPTVEAVLQARLSVFLDGVSH